MAKKETKKPQDTTVTEVAEEVVETPVEEEEVEEVVEPVAEPEVVEETPVVPVEGVDKESVTEEEYLMVGYEDYTGKFTPDVDGRLIELIVPDGMAGRVTTLLGEYDLIITINEDGRFTVGPFSGDKFNEAVRLVAGCGVMYRI